MAVPTRKHADRDWWPVIPPAYCDRCGNPAVSVMDGLCSDCEES